MRKTCSRLYKILLILQVIIVMNSAWNDYNDLFKDNVEWYAKFAYDFIKDEDAVEDKVYYYFTMIPKD